MNWSFLVKEFYEVSIYNYIIAAVLFFMGFFMKKYLSNMLSKIIFKLLNKRVEKGHLTNFQDLVLAPFQGLIVTILFYLGIQNIAKLLDDIIVFHKAASKSKKAITIHLHEVIDLIFYFCVIFYIILLASRVVDFISYVLLEKFKQKGDKERLQIYPLIKNILKVLIWTAGIFTILKTIFLVDVTALIAGLGIGGIAIAFALKDSLENLLASILIMLDKPFLIGDWVKVNGVEGTVENLGFRSTHIRTFDKTLVSIPNKKLIDNNLENLSERGTRRVKFEFGANYGISDTKLKKVLDLIKDKIDEHPQIAPGTSVFFDNFGDSSLNIVVTYFVIINTNTNFSKVKEDVNYIIYQLMYQ
jgi:MscS family membrane protein